jgi:L-asparaginase II
MPHPPVPTANPVVVEITRGHLVESRHRGALAVVDRTGSTVIGLGNIVAPVYPRSAIKLMQALPLIESGAADRFGLTDAEIALSVSSHNGEPQHVAAVQSMLGKAGLSEADLECGPQLPARDEDRCALLARGEPPRRIHNNCSGKHAGMLAAAMHLGLERRGYVRHDHPLQQRIRATMAEMTGTDLTTDRCGIDGCSVPTWAAPLEGWARAFASVATGRDLGADRRAAIERIRRAVAAHPFMVAGSGRFCTRVMEATGAAAFVKTGAEGVFCAALPDRGFGVALKIDDGASRAAETLMAAVLCALGGLEGKARAAVETLARQPVTDRNGNPVGEMRASAELRAALA